VEGRLHTVDVGLSPCSFNGATSSSTWKGEGSGEQARPARASMGPRRRRRGRCRNVDLHGVPLS